MSFTLVTALYEIKREEYDNRSFAQYQEWFSKTLTVPAPMIIYTELKNKRIIEHVRKNLPTKVVYTTLEEVPFYSTVPTVKRILETTPFKNSIKYPNGLENKCYEYIPVVNSKFKWILDGIVDNPFGTDMFFWIDAGISRFMNFDMAAAVFNTELINTLHESNKILFQVGKENELTTILNNPGLIDEYIGTNTNFIMAGFFGGNRELLMNICTMGNNLYIQEFIEKERVDNEQTLFGFILPVYKDRLYFIKNHPRQNYINYYAFCSKSI
jgi:hypothetical protein